MQKWGLVSGLCLTVLLGFGCENKPGIVKGAKGDCDEARYPFACILDKAMAAKDPSICVQVGEEKLMNCVRAYQQIVGEGVACEELKEGKMVAICKLFREN